jgi:predicted AlkP superfamily phosphohydrolase/phosphomutase
VAVWLPLQYFALAAIIELSFFGRLPKPFGYPFVAVFATGALILMACGLFLYRLFAVRMTMVTERRLLLGAGALAAVGVAMLSVRIGAVTAAQTAQLPALERQSNGSKPRPLLVIGLDGGNWRTLDPLIAENRVPTFARIAATGVQGDVAALWPPYWSTPAWGAILTGHTDEEVGVHEDLAATVRGLPPFELPLTLDLALNPIFLVELGLIHENVIEPTPVPRTQLRRAPIWERLSRAGAKTAVVRFPFTYPANGQADYVVSNRVVTDLWDLMGVEPGLREALVSPQGAADRLLAPFTGENTPDEAELRRILPDSNWPKPSDAIVNPVDVVRRVLGIGDRMFAVAEALVRDDPGLEVVMLHVTDFDNICHSFWQYRFPEDFKSAPPAKADADALGPVVDRYLEHLDRRLASLIAAFPTPPNVIVVADHGEEAATTSTLWKGWHSKTGLFLAAGPDIDYRTTRLQVSYYDIVPTMLDLLNFEHASDLRGVSIREVR